MRMILLAATTLLAACTSAPHVPATPPVPASYRPMIVISASEVTREEAPPHGSIGMSTAIRFSDQAPGRTMEFRGRILYPGAAIGPHVISHDEVYYVLSGTGRVTSDSESANLSGGMAAYLYAGARVGIEQTGSEPLDLIISYPLPGATGTSLLVDMDRQPDEIVPLWPDGPPGGVPAGLEEHAVSRDNPWNLPDHALHDVTAPALSVFRPQRPDGSAILLIPGGGYKWVVVEKEGHEGARWFARHGATVYVLSYRLPHQGWSAGADAPLQDAQRAMRLIRSRASQDGIDPGRVGVMGFSAGGHLAGSLTNRFDAPIYVAADSVDMLPARPDAAMLIYPVITLAQPFTHGSTSENMIGTAPTAEQLATFSVERTARADGPPVFILHASDDPAVPVDNALLAYDAFRKAGVPVTLHIFERGGHGFGLRGIDSTSLAAWPRLVMDWGTDQGLFHSDRLGFCCGQ